MEPDRARARQRITAGEVLTEPDVVATAGPRALIPTGWSALAVAEAVPSGAPVGDPVRAVAGVGSSMPVGRRTTGYGSAASCSAAPG